MVEQKDQTGEEANISDTVPPASYCNSHCSHGAHSSKLQQQCKYNLFALHHLFLQHVWLA